MKKIITAAFLGFAVLTAPTYALAEGNTLSAMQNKCDDIVVSGVSEKTLIQIKKNCVEEMDKAAKAVSDGSVIPSAQEMENYASVGKKYGLAISEVAKSIGTSANELAQTPLGMFILFLVAYSFIGADLLGMIYAGTWFTIMLPMWIYFFHKLVLDKNARKVIEYKDGRIERTGIDWNGNQGFVAFTMLIVLLCIAITGFVML